MFGDFTVRKEVVFVYQMFCVTNLIWWDSSDSYSSSSVRIEIINLSQDSENFSLLLKSRKSNIDVLVGLGLVWFSDGKFGSVGNVKSYSTSPLDEKSVKYGTI